MKNIYIAAADNLSRLKAYEFAEENGFDIVGQSAYVDDASAEISESNIDAVICSHKLFDGEAKELYNKLPEYIKNRCDFLVIAPVKNGTYKLKRMPYGKLRQTDSIIDTALDYVGMPKTIDGYSLYKEALDIILSTPDSLLNITQKIYKVLAKTHNANSKSVEYNMRTARDNILRYSDPEAIAEVFGDIPYKQTPSVSICLSKLADYIKKTR